MIDNNKLANLRGEYSQNELDESTVSRNPFEQFSNWLNDAVDSLILEPNAMVLATSDEKNIPSMRVVLLKEVKNEEFLFYTNYESKKAKDLSANPNAALLFYWRELGRQIRISGSVSKTSNDESEKYFITRPYDSKIGAWVSKQSSVISGRKFLEEKFDEMKSRFPDNVPVPSFWGGYKLKPVSFEFWQGRESRLHDRISYIKENDKWKIIRLSP